MELSSASYSLIPTNPKSSILGISVRRLSLMHCVVSSPWYCARLQTGSWDQNKGRVQRWVSSQWRCWNLGAIGTPLYTSWPAFVWSQPSGQSSWYCFQILSPAYNNHNCTFFCHWPTSVVLETPCVAGTTKEIVVSVFLCNTSSYFKGRGVWIPYDNIKNKKNQVQIG